VTKAARGAIESLTFLPAPGCERLDVDSGFPNPDDGGEFADRLRSTPLPVIKGVVKHVGAPIFGRLSALVTGNAETA
jgi:hypothetical protein